MDSKGIYDLEGQVSLKEHLEMIIRLRNDHVLDLMHKDQEYVKEAFDVFNENLEVHLDKLNHVQEATKEIAKANVNTDQFKALNARVEILEKEKSMREGSNKVTDVVKYLIGVFIGSLITGIILSIIK